MEALDGNAVAGALWEAFGTEMTTASGTCTHCGAVAQIAELAVYERAPGPVMRCRHCGQVVMVLVSVHGTMRVDRSCFVLSERG
jgi:uncharacterized Zn finger protein